MKVFIILLAALSVTSCSSIRSFESKNTTYMDEGLSYYMPKKDLKVTITVGNPEADKEKIDISVTEETNDNGIKTTTVTKTTATQDKNDNKAEITNIFFETTNAYPDLSKRYVLKHSSSLVSKNDLDIQITEQGLLTSSKSTTTSKIDEVFKSLAASVATIGANKNIDTDSDNTDKCNKTGVYTFIYEIPDEKIEDFKSPCEIDISIKKLTPSTPLATNKNTDSAEGVSAILEESYSGIFYRQNEPYKVSTSGDGINGFNVQSIIFSPSNSKTSLLPVKKTLFSDNVADFGLKDGVPTKYKQDVDAELVAILKLPADILTSYFAAVGTTFDAFKERDIDEAEVLNASLALELVKYKHDACIEAIKSKNDELISSLECKTP